nr:ATP synthase subunit gamma, mitochondrial [Tanacetum cinerariifolium]
MVLEVREKGDGINSKFKLVYSDERFVGYTGSVPEIVERESEAGGKIGDLDSYEIEGDETKAVVLQNLCEFQFLCVMFNAVEAQCVKAAK